MNFEMRPGPAKGLVEDAIADAEGRGVVVARFLGLLELYRAAAITFDQPEPLGELTVNWSGENFTDDALASLGGDYGA